MFVWLLRKLNLFQPNPFAGYFVTDMDYYYYVTIRKLRALLVRKQTNKFRCSKCGRSDKGNQTVFYDLGSKYGAGLKKETGIFSFTVKLMDTIELLP